MLPSGSVAVAVTDRQPGRRSERDCEDHLALAVGRHLQRPEVILRLARSAGAEAGTGEESMRKVVSGVLPLSQPSSPPSAVATTTGKFWKLLGPWRGALGVVGDPIVTEVDGLAAADDPCGKIAVGPRQRAVVVVGGLVVRGRPLAFVEGIVGLQPRLRAGWRRLMSWLISPADRALLQTRTSSIWPTKPYQPPGVAGQ